MVESRQRKNNGTAPKSEIDELKQQVATLTALITGGGAIPAKIENTMEEEENPDIIISSDSYIKVMSLTPYLLTLTTEAYGRGKKFDFRNFGDVKKILYHDLVDIMEQHQNFLDEGYFIILDARVVRRHGLDETYKHILTKEKLEQIMSGNQSDAVNLFKACSNAQRDAIATMLIEKKLANQEVDLNLLDRLSRVIGYNIADRAEEMQQIAQIGKKPEEK